MDALHMQDQTARERVGEATRHALPADHRGQPTEPVQERRECVPQRPADFFFPLHSTPMKARAIGNNRGALEIRTPIDHRAVTGATD